jgi:small subunit ribosomal protein S15
MQQSVKVFIEPFKRHEKDNGSTEVQIAILTWEIERLKEHLAGNHKDIDAKRALLKKVAKRKKLISYLKQKDFDSYKKIIKQLHLKG